MNIHHPLAKVGNNHQLQTDNVETERLLRPTTYSPPKRTPVKTLSRQLDPKLMSKYLKDVVWKKRKIRYDDFRTFGYTILWNVLMALFAACITFWVPSYAIWGINITSMIYNVIGSLIYAFVTTLQQVRYQYFQTYIIYDAVSGGFCSVLTTFGNFIVDTDILLGMQYGYLKALINWTGTLFFSFTFYQLGRIIALKWKAGARFTFDLLTMENEDRRIQHEVEKEEMRRLQDEENQILLSKREKDYGSVRSTITESKGMVKLVKLEQHLIEQMEKKQRHVTKEMKLRHILLLCAIILFIMINTIIVTVLQILSWSNDDYNIFAYDFVISSIWCVLGALAGRYIRLIGKPDRKGRVQWGTFRVNMISCIIIGTSHNILLLRRYIFGDSPYLTIVFQRLISNFCGSESNFGGFIDETTVLWNSRGCRMVAIRNFFYNLVLCTIVFLW